jgi:predicted alpha/beta superfamily hydrolase
VIVAIASANDSPFDVDGRPRLHPVPDAATGDRLSPSFGGAAAFRQFLVEELRPRIAQQSL